MTGWNTPPCSTVCLSSPVITTGTLLDEDDMLELDFTEELLGGTEELLGGMEELEATLELDATEELDTTELLEEEMLELDFTDELLGDTEELLGGTIAIPMQRTSSTYR